MSTSNFQAADAPFDPAVIARLANELFAALPGVPAPPPGAGIASAPPATPPVELGALPVAPAIPPSSAVGPLTEVEFRSLPATVSGAIMRPPQAGLTSSALLGPYEFRPELIPDEGAMTLPTGSAAPAPPVTPPVEMGTLSVVSAATPVAGMAPLTEAELRALPATLVSTQPGTPESSYYFLGQESSPPTAPAAGDLGSIPATPVSTPPGTPESSYYFLDQESSPPPAPVVGDLGSMPATLASTPPGTPGSSYYFLDQESPSLAEPVFPIENYGFHPDMLPDLGLTAGPYDPRLDRGGFPG